MKINGLTPTLLENGDIALNDSTGETKMLIPAAYMFDANGVFSDEIEYSLEYQNGQKYLLTVTADASWMNAEDRAYPVTIDPPLYTGSYLTNQVDDGYVYEGSPTEVTGAYEFMIAGYDVHSTSLRTRSYVKLNTLPTLPQSSVIVEATLNLRQVASDTLHFALNIVIYVDKYRNIVYYIGGNRFWAYLIIRGDRYEESDTENQICFILAQATQGVNLCFF